MQQFQYAIGGKAKTRTRRHRRMTKYHSKSKRGGLSLKMPQTLKANMMKKASSMMAKTSPMMAKTSPMMKMASAKPMEAMKSMRSMTAAAPLQTQADVVGKNVANTLKKAQATYLRTKYGTQKTMRNLMGTARELASNVQGAVKTAAQKVRANVASGGKRRTQKRRVHHKRK